MDPEIGKGDGGGWLNFGRFIPKKMAKLCVQKTLAFAYGISGDCGGQYGNSCYIVMPIPLNWLNASRWCQAVGGHLATIESQAENEVVHRAALASKFYKRK